MVIEQCGCLNGLCQPFLSAATDCGDHAYHAIRSPLRPKLDSDADFTADRTLVPVFMVLIGHATARKSRQQFAAMAQLSGRFLIGYVARRHCNGWMLSGTQVKTSTPQPKPTVCAPCRYSKLRF